MMRLATIGPGGAVHNHDYGCGQETGAGILLRRLTNGVERHEACSLSMEVCAESTCSSMARSIHFAVAGTTTPPSIFGIPKCPPRWNRSTGLIDPETTIKLTSSGRATRIAMSLI